MWAKIIDGEIVNYPYGPNELRRDNPNTSFPGQMSNEFLQSWGLVAVVPRNPPIHDYRTQNCTRVTPTLELDEWVETWEVTDASTEEIAQRTLELRSRMKLSFTQLLVGLVTEEWITVTEARAWRDRQSLPIQLQTIIEELPIEQQFEVETRAMIQSVILRSDPLVTMMGTAAGKTQTEIDTFFNTYAII